jgi:hypothetical protein
VVAVGVVGDEGDVEDAFIAGVYDDAGVGDLKPCYELFVFLFLFLVGWVACG